jgi:hypothetical protein
VELTASLRKKKLLLRNSGGGQDPTNDCSDGKEEEGEEKAQSDHAMPQTKRSQSGYSPQ